MTRITLLCASFFFSFLTVSAQIDDYPIHKYDRPVLKRKTLLVGGAMRSFNRFSSDDNISDMSTMSFEADLNYNSLKNDETTQRTTRHIINADSDLNFEEENRGRSVISHFSEYDVKKFQANQTFAGYSPSLYIYTEIDDEVTNPRKYGTLALPVGVGVGRIEIINDAWLAVSILKALRSEGQLIREPSHDEITAFAEEIARIKNERVLDFRRKRIYELDEIYRYLVNLNAVTENTLAFAILYDAWNFEVFDIRRSGYSAEIYLSPSYRMNLGENQFDNAYGTWSLRYRNFKPLNTTWDINSEFAILFNSQYNTNTNFVSEKQQIKDNMNLTMSTAYGVNYYLSRRTFFGWDNSIEFYKLFESSIENYTFSTRFNFVHWLSYQFRIVGNLGVSNTYIDRVFSQENTLSPNFNINLQYTLF